jgi:hypothetical protein
MTWRRLALICLPLLLLFALATPAAAARDVVHVHGRADVVDPDDPAATWVNITFQTAFAGRRVAISAYDRRAVPRVLLLRQDGSLRRLPEFDGPIPEPTITFYEIEPHTFEIGGQSMTIAASNSLLLVGNNYSTRSRDFSGYRVGDFQGSVGRWNRCDGLGNAYPNVIAVSGRAFAHAFCDPERLGVAVHDLGRPGSRPRRLGPPAGYRVDDLELLSAEMAGRFLAVRWGYRAGGVLQVFDWRSGREVYRLPPTEIVSDFSFALQRDGKVAVTQKDYTSEPTNCDRHTRFAWYSPSEPRAHPLPYRPCGPDLRMARDRIVYRGPGRFGTMLWMTDIHGRAPLRLSGTPWVLGGFDDLLPPFDFDGKRIVYGEPGCVDERVVRDSVAAIARRGYLHGMTCPVRFVGRHPISQTRDGRVAARIACPNGCTLFWWVDDVERRGATLLAGGDLKLPAGTTRTLRSSHTALPHNGRKPRRRRVRVVITAEQPSGAVKTIARTVTILTTREPRADGVRRLRRAAPGRAGD